MAKRETRVKIKTIAINFFFIENPSFQLDVSDFTYIDEGHSDIIQKTEIEILDKWVSGMMEEWRDGIIE
jgi:hypothetical protein